MKKTNLSISVLTGIAVMLSMSIMPASASPPENVCVAIGTGDILCTIEPAVGQHALLNLESLKSFRDNYPTGGCHYDIYETEISGTPYWVFYLVDGPNKCEDHFGVSKAVVKVAGN